MSLKTFWNREYPIAKQLGYIHLWHSIIRVLNIKTKHEWIDIDCRHHALMRKWMDENFMSFAEQEYKNNYTTSTQNCTEHTRIIWQLWYQGIEQAPDLIQNCMNSVGQWLEIEKAERKILDEKTLEQLNNFPKWMLQKYHKGIISKQCFSDIIRFWVLSRYGGIWIDSTIMQTAPLEKHIFDFDFFSLKMPYIKELKAYVPHCKWTAFFLASKKQNVIMSMAFSIMSEYWHRFDSLVDYYLVDYIIDFLYRNFPDCQNQIEKLPQTAPDIFWLIENQNKQWDKNEVDEVLKRTYLHKLNWRFKPSEKKDSIYNTLVNIINEKK